MYEFKKVAAGWKLFWGPAPVGLRQPAKAAPERKVTRVSREQLAATTTRIRRAADVSPPVAR